MSLDERPSLLSLSSKCHPMDRAGERQPGPHKESFDGKIFLAISLEYSIRRQPQSLKQKKDLHNSKAQRSALAAALRVSPKQTEKTRVAYERMNETRRATHSESTILMALLMMNFFFENPHMIGVGSWPSSNPGTTRTTGAGTSSGLPSIYPMMVLCFK